MINEAVYTLYEGVGSVRSDRPVDEAGCQLARWAPLELGDFIGLDTCPFDHERALCDGLADSKYRPCPLW